MSGQIQSSWFRQNLKKTLAGGCFLILLTAAGGAFVLFSIVFGAIKSSTPYKEGVARAIKEQRLIKHLGEPVEAGFFVTGNINYTGTAGKADLAVPLSGPQASGKLFIDAYARSGNWAFQSLIFKGDGGKEIDLLKDK